MNFHSLDLVIFDMDGVLIDTSGAHSLAFADVWKSAGVEGPLYEEIAGMSTADAIRKTIPFLTDDQVREWAKLKQRKTFEYLETRGVLFDDTLPSLRLLKERRIRMALGTSASRERTKWTLNRYRLSHFFFPVVTADDLKRGKPHPEIYLLIMEHAGVSPERTLIVEDSLSGLNAGLASRAYVVSVRTGVLAAAERFVGNFSDLSQLVLFLERL